MKRIFMIAVAIFATVSLFAEKLPNDPAVKTGKLDNGLTYYIRHNNLPAGRCDFYLATNVGAIQETPDQDGLAHFLEHMCFNGLKNLPGKQMLEYLQHIGAEFGRNINAGTGVEQTQYKLTDIPVSREGIVDTCLLILHDYSHFVINDPKEIEAERGIIVEEKRTRNNAGWRMFEKSLPYLYGGSKYASCTLIGSEENLKTFKPESLKNFYKSWYRPDLQAVIIVGDIDVESVYNKLVKLFADIPAPEQPTVKQMPEVPMNDSTVVAILTDPENTNTSIDFYWKIGKPYPLGYNATSQAYLERTVKAVIYSVMSERFEEISSSPDAVFTSASLSVTKLCDTMESIEGSVSADNSKILDACRTFLTEVERMKRYGFSQDEIERVKENLLKSLANRVAGASTRTNDKFVRPLVNNFFFNYPYMTPEAELEEAKKACERITPELVNTYITQLFKQEHLTVIYTGIEKEGQKTPTEADIQTIIAQVKTADIKANFAGALDKNFMQDRKVSAGKIKSSESSLYGATVWKLSNGLRVVVLPTEYRKNQIIFDLRIKGGLSRIPTEDLDSFDDSIMKMFFSNSGIAQFPHTTAMKMMSGRIANVTPYITSIYNGIGGSCAPEDLETAMQLLYLQIKDPRFDEEEWDVGIKKISTILPNIVSTPDYTFSEHMFKAVYNDNPRKQLLTESKLANASLETFAKNYRILFDGVAGSTLYIVGKVDVESLKPLVEKYCASLPKGKKNKNWVLENTISYRQGEDVDIFNAKMKIPKASVVQFYNADIPYTLQKSVNLSAAQFILNRIYVNTLREEEGGTYGAHSSMSIIYDPVNRAKIQVNFDTNMAQYEKLCTLAIKGLKDLAANGPSQEELRSSLENALKKIPENRISNKYWLAAIERNDLIGGDFDIEYENAVKAITAEGIKAVLKEILDSGNFIQVVMLPEE